MERASTTDGDAGRGPLRVFLVGPMAAGKTTVGRQLAGQLGLAFCDTDQEVERRCGVPIGTIFDFEGEQGFRERERALVDELTQRPDIVLATGGGAILDPDNRARLKARGHVVYLWVSIDERLRRTERDRTRPLLQVADRRSRLEALEAARDPLYRETADCMIATNGQHRGQVVAEIQEWMAGS